MFFKKRSYSEISSIEVFIVLILLFNKAFLQCSQKEAIIKQRKCLSFFMDNFYANNMYTVIIVIYILNILLCSMYNYAYFFLLYLAGYVLNYKREFRLRLKNFHS